MRNLTTTIALALLLGIVCAVALTGAPAFAQRGATAQTAAPVPAVPPPVSAPGLPAAQTPTNPPERVAPPAGAAQDRPALSAPLTGGTNGSLAGSDQVNPSVGTTSH